MTGTEYCDMYKNAPEKAYSALFKNYCDYVYAIVFNKLRSVASHEDIEECVSDIFAEIFFSYKKSSESAAELKGYISTVAKRKAINAYHSLKARSGHFSGDSDDYISEINSGSDIEEDYDKLETQTILIDKINDLGEPDSTIILQKYYYNRSSNEIAEMLSMKASAVRMRAARALDKLRESLTAAGITLKGDA